LVPIDLTVNN